MTPDQQGEIEECAGGVIAKLKREWPHLRSGEHDEDMVNLALVVALDKVLPRHMPRSMGGTLCQYAWPRVHGALLEYATETATHWSSSKDGTRQMLEECRSPVDFMDVDIEGEIPEPEEDERRAAVRARLLDLDEPDLGLVLQLEAMEATCKELGDEMGGLHHNVIAHRRDRAIERLRTDPVLRAIHENDDIAEAAAALASWSCAVAAFRPQPVARPSRRRHCWLTFTFPPGPRPVGCRARPFAGVANGAASAFPGCDIRRARPAGHRTRLGVPGSMPGARSLSIERWAPARAAPS